jgi:hypothetical protein
MDNVRINNIQKWDVLCFIWGTDWIFKYNLLTFIWSSSFRGSKIFLWVAFHDKGVCCKKSYFICGCVEEWQTRLNHFFQCSQPIRPWWRRSPYDLGSLDTETAGLNPATGNSRTRVWKSVVCDFSSNMHSNQRWSRATSRETRVDHEDVKNVIGLVSQS